MTEQVECFVNKLFTFTSWDGLDDFNLVFYNCVLQEDVGTYQRFYIVPSISVDFVTGVMVFYDDKGEVIKKFQLELMVKEELA